MRQRTADQSGSFPPLGPDPLILPSRRTLLERARRELEDAPAPLLLSGEPGIGKTWLAQRLIAQTTRIGTTWLTLDLAPGIDPEGLLLALAHRLALGVPEPWTAPLLRVAIAAALEDLSHRGRRIALVVDEAHLASPAVLEELRVWSNRLRLPDGLDSLLLIGQTPLLRSLHSAQAQALKARIAWSASLRPINADEALLLVQSLHTKRSVKLQDVEAWHAAALGNPARFLRIARQALRQRNRPHHGHSLPHRVRRLRGDLPHPTNTNTNTNNTNLPPPLLPSHPPLLHEDGLIEVGYAGDDLPESFPSPPIAEAAPPLETQPRSDRVPNLHPPDPTRLPTPAESADPGPPSTPAQPARTPLPRGPLRPESQHDRTRSSPHFARGRSEAE